MTGRNNWLDRNRSKVPKLTNPTIEEDLLYLVRLKVETSNTVRRQETLAARVARFINFGRVD